ncbi:MAG TPA: carbamoyl phosphate synthase small subunit, partial [Clostridia bacterium]|nr:carbamoyl phosphate synthase small subunit [Clostridia bacterium]
LSVIQKLNHFGCNLVVVPYNTSYEEVMRFKPDGLFLSEGPGNPEELTETVNLVKKLRGVLPILGIGLGHQIIALAYGAKIYKMKTGQHGSNIPVKNVLTNKIEITSQNHNYAVDNNSLEERGLINTHINLLDGHVEGMKDETNNVISMQFCPGNEKAGDCECLFNKFSELMIKAGGNGNAKENRY